MMIADVNQTRTEPAEPAELAEPCAGVPPFERALEVLAVAVVYAVLGVLVGGLVALLPVLAGGSPWGVVSMACGAAVGAVAGVLLETVRR